MAYEELKQRQSAMWGSAPYQRVTETLPIEPSPACDLHGRVDRRCPPGGFPLEGDSQES